MRLAAATTHATAERDPPSPKQIGHDFVVPDTELLFAGAFAQAQRLRVGRVSAVELIDATLQQIERVDPLVNAFRVVLVEHARAAAIEADARRRNGNDGALLGVPVAVADDTDVAGEVTAWGTDAYGPAKTEDATVVARLRSAGAIIIGKTNVPEVTTWPWTVSPTWGVTSNPWDRSRTPGGSSGGSAVAVATGMCGVALSSDGGGSVRLPAAAPQARSVRFRSRCLILRKDLGHDFGCSGGEGHGQQLSYRTGCRAFAPAGRRDTVPDLDRAAAGRPLEATTANDSVILCADDEKRAGPRHRTALAHKSQRSRSDQGRRECLGLGPVRKVRRHAGVGQLLEVRMRQRRQGEGHAL